MLYPTHPINQLKTHKNTVNPSSINQRVRILGDWEQLSLISLSFSQINAINLVNLLYVSFGQRLSQLCSKIFWSQKALGSD